MKGKSIQQTIDKMNNELSQIVHWLNSNKLSLNVTKTHYMIFRSKTQKIDTHSQLKINGIVIDFVSSTKFIGVK